MTTSTTHHGFTGQEGFEIFTPISGEIGTDLIHRPRKNKGPKDLTHQDPCTSKPKPKRKPDPGAAKITPPCSECGRRFWSWKALFGHMRCHPERQWRGINPPPNHRRAHENALEAQFNVRRSHENTLEAQFNDDEYEVASSLVMLANGAPKCDAHRIVPDMAGVDLIRSMSSLDCRFECGSCKKVFGSHQALGGHRASHKNVKGCFAIARNYEGDQEEIFSIDHGRDGCDKKSSWEETDHKCNVCARGFSSGKLLGGHKRCHWEKGDEDVGCSSSSKGYVFDLNLPPPVETCGGSCSDPGLDLKLHI